MKTIDTQTFRYTLKDIHKNTQNRKFCFVIGAGASRKSGIPTGGELAAKWFEEIRERTGKADLDTWISEHRINESDLAASYGSIYRKRFENDKTSGYEFLVQAMKHAKPSFGHIVLAQILSRTSGHCVLTTNFDSLVESSVYQFTNKTPLVCGHESLSGYARPSQTHPLIVKIHRDLLLSPQSDPDEINKLNPGWKEPLDHIFSTHIPVVIGYGGNDGSLMDYFENMNKPSNFFWCGLDAKTLPEKTKNLITKHDGCFVTIDGYDELMHKLLLVFDEIRPIDKELNEITSARIQTALKQLNDIAGPPPPQAETAPSRSSEQSQPEMTAELSALEYKNLADQEPDLEKRKAIYLEALGKYPTTAWLWWEFTYFLHFIKNDNHSLKAYYEKALELNKNESGLLGNYALFLQDIQKDHSAAEDMFLQALAITPADNNGINYGNYAIFLHNYKKDYVKADEYYRKALEMDANNVLNNFNYALFLQQVKKDFDTAETYYLKGIALNPDSAKSYSRYANFLETCRKDYAKADEYYQKALSIDARDFTILGLYANFFKNAKKDYINAEETFRKALLINPDDSYNIFDYAYFLKNIKRDYEQAETYFIRAVALNPEHCTINLGYAVFLKDVKKDPDEAQIYYTKALTLNPDDAESNANYAQFLLEQGKKKDAEPFLAKAITAATADNLMLELWFYRYAHFPELLKSAEENIGKLLGKGVRSLGWNFEGNIERAVMDKHPDMVKLRKFATEITSE